MPRSARHGLVGVLVLGILPAAASAAPPNWRLTRLGSEHGLSHNSVYSIAQDRTGFLWIGTVDGLNRYDGYEFTTFRPDPADETSLSNQIVRALLEDRAGYLWVGTEDGLNRFDPAAGRFLRYALGVGEPTVVWSLFEDASAGLFVGTDRGAFRRGSADAEFEPIAVSTPGAVRALDGAPDGTVWALVEGLESTHIVALTGPGAEAPPRRIPTTWGMAIDRGGRSWTNPPSGGVATVVRVGRDRSLWMGTEPGLCHAATATDPLTCSPLVEGGSWLDNYVRALHEDQSGAWWIGTYTGLYRYDPGAKPFARLRHDPAEPKSLASDAVSAILEDSSGALWVGTFGGGLDRFDRRTARAVHHRRRPGDPTSLCDDLVWTLHEDGDGTLWIGTGEGLCSLDPERRGFRAHPYPERVAPGRRRILDIAAGPEGELWLAADTGLYRVEPASGDLVRVSVQLPAETLAVTRDGHLWFDASGVALGRFEPGSGRVTRYPLRTRAGHALSSEGIWTMHQDRAGALWLGTGSGLLRFEPSSATFDQFSTRDGLPGAVVYGILEDDAGRLWLGTNRGLSRFDGKRFRNYDLLDGIGSLEFNRRAAFRGRSGEFLFGGVDGLLSFHPDQIHEDERPPQPAITAIEVGRRQGTERRSPWGLDRLVLDPRDRWFALEFSALAFADPAKNRYAHRLEGLEDDWIEIGTRRVARYTSVPPGEYTFHLKAANHDGVWSQTALALPIVVQPPFWRTPWFALFVVTVCAALLYAAYRMRVQRLLGLERLRVRIASDLHDDLSTDLASIALSTDLLLRTPGLDEPSRARLGEVRERAERMVGAVRDTVWAVNPQHDSWESLLRRMRTTARDLLGDTLARFEAPAELPGDLGMAERRTLFLLFKEMVHNAARHAHASRVEIALQAPAGGGLDLEVRDDGVGFDLAQPGGGAGLDNLKRRAVQLGGSLEVESAPGAGTAVRFRKRSRKSGMAADTRPA